MILHLWCDYCKQSERATTTRPNTRCVVDTHYLHTNYTHYWAQLQMELQQSCSIYFLWKYGICLFCSAVRKSVTVFWFWVRHGWMNNIIVRHVYCAFLMGKCFWGTVEPGTIRRQIIHGGGSLVQRLPCGLRLTGETEEAMLYSKKQIAELYRYSIESSSWLCYK